MVGDLLMLAVVFPIQDPIRIQASTDQFGGLLEDFVRVTQRAHHVG